ncbi:pickpocket protein 28-like [Episyrphus balteatus]|uniref:pickpocket protein 28-like n=1 Tax=Episyrphus balteatus TaxID=286459 RepID=UPI0024854DC9|nr:pickpocket protein 28-like [Episyrphus balteatus]
MRSVGRHFANASDLIMAMLKLAPIFNETMNDCYWKRTNFECDEYFDYTLTDEGICYSFNSLKSAHYRTELYNSRRKEFIGYNFDNDRNLDWDLENGYNKQANEETFPKRVLGDGELESLILFITDSKQNNEFMCRNGVHGFKIILHTPGEEPNVSKKFVSIPYDQTAVITINPQIVSTSDGLEDYDPERRQCYYQNERYLRYFTVYTKVNCELECLANQTLAKCGCVKFAMPSKLYFLNIEYKAEVEHQVDINVMETATAFREEDLDFLLEK